MTEKEIFQKALSKAVKSGFKVNIPLNLASQRKNEKDLRYRNIYYTGVIFSHGFAKAFWGENDIVIDRDGNTKPAYILGLQEMASKEYPLLYLKQYL